MKRRPRRLSGISIQKGSGYGLEEARRVQLGMIPAEPLKDQRLEVECRFRPVAEVGGDFLDYFWTSDQQLSFFIGDVVGKGLPAALYAALVVGVLRGLKKSGEPPTSVLEQLNRRLLDRAVPNRYCAVQYAVFDLPSREFSLANAGLAPRPLYISATDCRELGEGGLPCGMFKDARYHQEKIRLGAGDAVLFCTDGIIEARNRKGEEFELERLAKICAASKTRMAGDLLALVFEAVDQFTAGARQHDDMTAAVLHIL